MAKTTLSPGHKFISLLPKVWGWDSDVGLISRNHCSTKPTTFYTWMEDTPLVIWVFPHICFPELCCQLPADLSACCILWNLSWERVQLSMELFWFFTLFHSAGSWQSPNQPIITKNHLLNTLALLPAPPPKLIRQACLVQMEVEFQTGCFAIMTFSFIEWKLRCKQKRNLAFPATNLLN